MTEPQQPGSKPPDTPPAADTPPVGQPAPAPPTADESPDAPPRRSRTGLVLGLALSLAAVVGLAIPLAMLATARASWEGQNEELRASVAALTDEVSDQNTRLAELEAVRDQLDELKRRYSEAVNSGAVGTESARELEEIIEAYQRCVSAQTEHFAVLRNIELYVRSSVDESEASILDFCNEVAAAYAEIRTRG